MSDIPDIDFDGDDDAFFQGRVNLTLDGSVWADLFSATEEPFFGTGAVLDLTEFYQALGYDPRSEIDRFIEERLQPYDGVALTKNHRSYFGIDQLRSKLEGMRGAWHLIDVIYIDSSGGDLLDVYIVHIENS